MSLCPPSCLQRQEASERAHPTPPMERSRRLLLVAGLLAELLPAAAATALGPQPRAACEPALLATQVALFCTPDMPTVQCCEPLVAAVVLGGGVRCLCRVAAERQLVTAGLNSTHLLTLYNSCRRRGAHLAVLCQDQQPHLSSQRHGVCPSATGLGTMVGVECGMVPMQDDCCSMLEMATSSPDVLACLCLLSQDLGVSEAGLSIGDVIKTYTHCTGLHPHLPAAGCSYVLANKTSPQQLTHARVEPMQEKRVRPRQFITD